VKLVHLVGITIKKFVTTHGQMNAKLVLYHLLTDHVRHIKMPNKMGL